VAKFRTSYDYNFLSHVTNYLEILINILVTSSLSSKLFLKSLTSNLKNF